MVAQNESYGGGRILIVDDEEANIILLERMLLRAGYTNLTSTQDSREFFDLLEAVAPDLILLDLLMPHMDGYEVLEQLRSRLGEHVYLPVMVLTADVTSQALQRALSLGAHDFLTKPFDQTELLLRVRNLLQTRFLYRGLQQQMEQLENLNLMSQQAILVRDDSLSTIVHDIGQPLAAMRFSIEVLQELAKRADDRLAVQLSENVRRIDAASGQMAAMISEIADLARLQMGRELMLHKRPLDLITLAKSQISLHGQSPRGRIKLRTAAKSVVGNWDEVRLSRVLSNLLSNAVKFSPRGGEISLSIDREADAAWLSVRDRGVGIPAEDLPHIFDAFYRGGNVAGKIEGSGVGLASARHIIEQHSGSISIESEAGQGTKVTLVLPLS